MALLTPVQIDNSGDLSAINDAERNISVLPNNNRYVVFRDTTTRAVSMFKSTDLGETWNLQDSSNQPLSSDYECVCGSLDSTGIINVLFWDFNSASGNFGLNYIQFDTSTDTWGTVVNIQTPLIASNVHSQVSVAIDSGDKLHVTYIDNTLNRSGTFAHVFYTNNVSGSWSATIDVENVNFNLSNPDIAIKANGRPMITYIRNNSTIAAAKGNTNNATSFTVKTAVDNSANVSFSRPSICVLSTQTESGGAGNDIDAYIGRGGQSGVGSANVLLVAYHIAADPWANWNTIVLDSNGNNFYSDVSITSDQYDNVYLMVTDSSSNIVFYQNKGNGWTSGAIVESGIGATQISAKFAQYADTRRNSRIDTIYVDNANVIYYTAKDINKENII